MLKYMIIEPHHKKFDDTNLSSFVKKLRSIERKNISPNRTFIICSHDYRMLGGASLLQKNLTAIQEDLQLLVPAFMPPSDYVWECSRIHLENLSAPADLPLLQSYYRTLYEGLGAFAKQKGIRFIILRLKANAYRASQEYGLALCG